MNIPAAMMDDCKILIEKFTGRSDQDAHKWLLQFQNFVAFKRYDQLQSAHFFALRLTDVAQQWFNVLPGTISSDIDNIYKAFQERFCTHPLQHFIVASKLFHTYQENEPVQDFISNIILKARQIKFPDEITCYAILNGLKPKLRSFVLQQSPELNLQDIQRFARLGEFTQSDEEIEIQKKVTLLDNQIRTLQLKVDQLQPQQPQDVGLRDRNCAIYSQPLFQCKTLRQQQHQTPIQPTKSFRTQQQPRQSVTRYNTYCRRRHQQQQQCQQPTAVQVRNSGQQTSTDCISQSAADISHRLHPEPQDVHQLSTSSKSTTTTGDVSNITGSPSGDNEPIISYKNHLTISIKQFTFSALIDTGACYSICTSDLIKKKKS